MVILSKEHDHETVAMRDAYCGALTAAAGRDGRIVTVEADVMHSMGTVGFADRFPQRCIFCGIQEANCAGVAAGLSAAGLIPFFHSFAAFASRRAYDQLLLSCAYAGLNVKIIGGDPGVTATNNGGTHMPFEDMGIMRNIPGATIIEPADSTAVGSLVPQMAERYGVAYMRVARRFVAKIYEAGSEFEIGRAAALREGSDVAIIACGIMVCEALKAADILQEQGLSARVVDMFTIKPIDAACITDCAKKTGAVVTAENHSIINGLGSAVSEVITSSCPVPLERVGVRDVFGEVGNQEYLMKKFGLTAEDIVEKAIIAIRRKTNCTLGVSTWEK